MRRTTTTFIALAGLLVSGAASAAETPKEAGKGATEAGAPTGTDPGGGKTSDLTDTRDRPTDTTFANKTWGVSAGIEYHHVGLDGGYIDNGAARNGLYVSAGARWDPTPFDRLQLRWGFSQAFLADAGESGARSDDISLSYTRRFPLPGQTNLRLSGSLTAPVSYGSQLAGIYTVPKLSLSADKKFGKYFSMDARVTGSVFIVKYASGGSAYNGGGISGFGAATNGNGIGGNGGGAMPNPKAGVSMALGADLAMPFHTPLSIGLGLYVSYAWMYDVCGSVSSAGQYMGAFGMAPPAGTCNLPAENANSSQPYFQSYGDEIYVRYAFPAVGGFSSDLAAAFAPNGDPTTGFASVTHGTGIGQVYPFYYRQNAEVYFTFSARY
jgi:hypothetical protein